MEKNNLYTVKVEAWAPVELTYKIWATTPEEALEKIKNSRLAAPPRPFLNRKKLIKATVYKYGSMLIEFTKRFL